MERGRAEEREKAAERINNLISLVNKLNWMLNSVWMVLTVNSNKLPIEYDHMLQSVCAMIKGGLVEVNEFHKTKHESGNENEQKEKCTSEEEKEEKAKQGDKQEEEVEQWQIFRPENESEPAVDVDTVMEVDFEDYDEDNDFASETWSQ